MKPLSPCFRGPGRRRAREVIVGAAMIAVLLGFVAPAPVSAATRAKDAKTQTAQTPQAKQTPQVKQKAQIKQTANPLPVMNVTDVKSGTPFALASAFTGAKPMLVWFWAPN